MNNQQAYNVGKRFFLWGMVSAMVLGLAYLFTFGNLLGPFMRTAAVWIALVAIILSLGALHFFFRRKFVLSGLLLLVSMLGMVTIRHIVRLLVLGGSYDPATYAIKPQWSVFAVFLICFVIAIAVVWYMFRLFFGRQQAAAT